VVSAQQRQKALLLQAFAVAGRNAGLVLRPLGVDGRVKPGHDEKGSLAAAYFTPATRAFGIDCENDPL
jgi:hypothetical protein